jgi:hypothetical protein
VYTLLVVWNANSPLLQMNPANALFLPASVPAALAMRDRGLRTVKISDFLEPRDFHELWERVVSTVWKAVEAAASPPNGKEPRLLPIFGYSIAIAVAQALALGRFLDRIHARHSVAHVRVDGDAGRAEHVFCSGLDDMFYCEAAVEWAEARGIECHRLQTAVEPAAPTAGLPKPVRDAVRKPFSFLGVLRRFKRMASREAGRLRRGPIGQLVDIAFAVARGNRIVLLTNCAERLPPPVATHRANIVVMRIAGALPTPKRMPAVDDVIGAFLRSAEWQRIADIVRPFDGYLARRLSARIASLWRGGFGTYRYASRLVRAVRACGAMPVILADAPFCDFTPEFAGFATEAFRQHGGRIAEMQHGGNYTCTERGLTAGLLTNGLGHLFFEWNDLACREHEVYGLQPPHLKFADVGYWAGRAPVRACRDDTPVPGDRPLRVLYAPTLLSTATICGFNLLWDDYVDVLDRILGLLDRSSLQVDVSIVPNDEMTAFLSRRHYPNLRIHPLAFRRLAGEVDVLIAESLAGSPPYEATVTDKPAIVLTGAKYLGIDQRFMSDLRRRCIAYDDFDSYVAGLEDFVADPQGFLGRNVRVTDTSLMARYFRPLDADRFWGSLNALGAAASVK